jgi:hypothetical protein
MYVKTMFRSRSDMIQTTLAILACMSMLATPMAPSTWVSSSSLPPMCMTHLC